MDRDSKRMRDGRPYIFASLRNNDGVAQIVDQIKTKGGL